MFKQKIFDFKNESRSSNHFSSNLQTMLREMLWASRSFHYISKASLYEETETTLSVCREMYRQWHHLFFARRYPSWSSEWIRTTFIVVVGFLSLPCFLESSLVQLRNRGGVACEEDCVWGVVFHGLRPDMNMDWDGRATHISSRHLSFSSSDEGNEDL